MNGSRKKWGFVVGVVAALTLGVIAVASAAGTQTATPSPSASAQAGQAHTPDFDGDGPHRAGDGGHGHGRGCGGDIAEALAKLSGTDVSTIMTERATGRSFAEIAKAEGVGTDELLAEATRTETAELDAAVKAGTMTGTERTQALSGLQAHLKEELTETHALPREGGHGYGWGGDGPRGSAAGQSASGSTRTD
jgi:hypothetical protein